MNVNELREKTDAYKEYIKTHQRNVLKAWMDMTERLDLDRLYPGLYNSLENRVKYHDESKFWDEEFYGYRNHFYRCEGEREDADAYAKAWWNHYHCNNHHWQFWLDDNGCFKPVSDPLDVLTAYLEMICDWQAMSYVFGGTALTYYEENKDEIKLLPEWADFVVGTLTALYG